MHNPIVTVYITNYNYGKFIRQAIESVLNQTYNNIDLLIIDDGSTDNSHEIIKEYEHLEHVRVIFQSNKGLNATNNVALNAAKGKYIIRLDADDYFEPYALSMMIALMEGNKEIGLVFPDYYYIDEIGNIIGVESRHDFDREVSLYDLPSHGACTMVRTEELKELGGYNESFSCQDGYELWLKYILNSKVSNISKPLFYYRQHKSSLTTNENRILETRKRIKQYCIEQYNIPSLKSVVIVPIRPNTINGHLWALHQTNGKTEIYWAIKKLVDAKCFQSIIITCSDQQVIDEVEKIKALNEISTSIVEINTYKRNYTHELANHSLDFTFKEIIDHFELRQNFDAIGLLGIETPLIKTTTIQEAVNSLRLFEANAVICVRQDHSTYFTHNGNGMTMVFEKSRYTNYERKVLYKRVSGFSIARIDAYLQYKSFLTSRLGHVIILPEEALVIQSEMDLKLYNALVSN